MTQPNENSLIFHSGMVPPRNPYIVTLNALQDNTLLAATLLEERERLCNLLKSPRRDPAALALPYDGVVDGVAITRAFSDLIDAVIGRMFVLACQQAGANPQLLPISIVATGGYGRRELCPFSDIDITFIPRRDGDPLLDRVIRSMFTQIMDICIARCGLAVGYAYRLLEDCTDLDHKTTSGLLDARLIVGNERLFIQFEDAFWLGFNSTEFIFTKLTERRAALAKWGETPRVVEPQLKEGPGGLRDLQSAVWLIQARHQFAASRARGERALELLIHQADLPAADATRLLAAKNHLLQVRSVLHAISGAERDQLVVTRQEEVATALGYGDEAFDSSGAASHESPPMERMMASLYPDLAFLRHTCERIMRRVENSRLILGIGLDCKRRTLVSANEALDSEDPYWLLWACELSQRYGLEWGDDVEAAARSLLAMNPVLGDTVAASHCFTRILSNPVGLYATLQRMADLGILGWFLPAFAPLLDLIPYDPSHDYTIGQHTLTVIRNLERLREETHEEFSELVRVFQELPNPEQLMLAALLHDCGKSVPGRPHADVGADIAADVCRFLQWNEEATANVVFLVKNHLVMAETSRLRDLNQEETVRDFVHVVDDPDRLNMLYLLTYADTRAVGEGVWTAVKGRFLRELWQRAMGALVDEETSGSEASVLLRARRRLLKELTLKNLPEAEVQEHIEAMPPGYLLNQSLAQMALHIDFVRRVRAGKPVIDFHDERHTGITELTVCVYDDPTPGLLAKIARALYFADVNVHSAQVMTRVTERDHIALDTLWVDFKGRPLTPGKRQELTTLLLHFLTGAPPLAARYTSRKAKASPPVPPRVLSIRNDLSDSLTVIDLAGGEKQGTLAVVCEALTELQWDILSARVSSWHGETRASFYVADARTMAEAETRLRLEHALNRTGIA